MSLSTVLTTALLHHCHESMSRRRDFLLLGLSCIDPCGAIHLQRSGQLFFSARSGQNNPECPCCKATSQRWQALIYPWTGTLGCDDDTAHTTSNWPQLLLHPCVCLLPIRWDKWSPLYVLYYLFFSATNSHMLSCGLTICAVERLHWWCRRGGVYTAYSLLSHGDVDRFCAPHVFSIYFVESLSFSKKLSHFFYLYSHLLKYLSLSIIQNHIFLLILELLSRAQGVDTSTDLQKLERSVLCVRNSQWNLRNRLQTRYVTCQQF